MIQSDPAYPLCLKGDTFNDACLSAVCKLNGKDFPPWWAEGRKVLCFNVIFDKMGRDGMSNNLWNGVLDHPEYDNDYTDDVLKDQLLVEENAIMLHIQEYNYERLL